MILRRDVNRDLTHDEVDGNFIEAENLSQKAMDSVDSKLDSLQDTTARYAFDTLQEAQDKWASFSQEEKDELDGKEYVIDDKVYKWKSATQPQETDFVRNLAKETSIKLDAEGINEFNPEKIQNDKRVMSGGNVADFSGFKTVVGQPVIGGQTYTISGVTTYGSKLIAFKDANGALVGTVQNFGSPPKTITAPIDAVTVDYTVKFDTETTEDWYATLMWEKGSEVSEYEAFSGYSVIDINEKSIKAKGLERGNIVPDPVTDYNAVNKKYFEEFGVTDSDLELQRSPNLFNPDKIVDGKYVNSVGTITTGALWKYIVIDISHLPTGADITIGRINVGDPGYYAFWTNETEGPVEFGTYPSGVSSNLVKPEFGHLLLMTIKRNSDSDTVYSEGTVNEGLTLLTPYEPYEEPYITNIKGYNIKGGDGEAYNQPLNTFNSVEFASLQAGALNVDLPSGATEPSGLEIGDAWVDTTNGVIKVKLS